MATCELCGGRGYLEVEQFGKRWVKDGTMAIERCDDCQVFGSDQEAAVWVATRREIKILAVRLVNGDSSVKAFVDVSFGGQLFVKGFIITDGKSGPFVSVPRKPAKAGRWVDVIEFPDEYFKKAFEEMVLDEYAKHKEGK